MFQARWQSFYFEGVFFFPLVRLKIAFAGDFICLIPSSMRFLLTILPFWRRVSIWLIYFFSHIFFSKPQFPQSPGSIQLVSFYSWATGTSTRCVWVLNSAMKLWWKVRRLRSKHGGIPKRPPWWSIWPPKAARLRCKFLLVDFGKETWEKTFTSIVNLWNLEFVM